MTSLFIHPSFGVSLRGVWFALIAILALFACLRCVSTARADVASPPNVLLILTDDQGWGDLAVHGNESIRTPTLDRLSQQSVRLNRFFVSPVCAPTRAALLTGRYPERGGVAGVTGRLEVMRSSEVTLAERFRAAGYATGCFGKWHNGAQMPLHPNGQGFDTFFGFCGGHFNFYDDPVLERNGVEEATKGYITDLFTDEAIQFISRSKKQPYFCYVPFNAPHGPFQVDPNLFEHYRKTGLDPKTAAVYAMVQNIDDNVGRLLQAIDDRGDADNTIVIFMTDNGPNGKRYNGGMRGIKGSVHEGGCRVPCFVRWPARLQPRDIEQITGHIDITPTLQDWCGLTDTAADKPLDGQSLTQLLTTGQDAALNKRVILTLRPQSTAPGKLSRAAARTSDFRLVIEKSRTSLFDMRSDPEQRTDVSSAHPAIVKQLTQQIENYIDETKASVHVDRPVPIVNTRPVFIPAVDATLSGECGFADEVPFAHSWVDRWQQASDSIQWSCDVLDAGRYELILHYVCAEANVPVVFSMAGQRGQQILPVVDHVAVRRPDLDPTANRRMLRFGQHRLGTVELTKAVHGLSLKRGTDGNAMMELFGITLRSVD
ncbi:MAG: arylsulfatase [Planctomycetota bacterium]